jgi:hypothetical protein
MGGISRRLDHDAGQQIGTGFGEEGLHRRSDARGEKGENVHDRPDQTNMLDRIDPTLMPGCSRA